MNPVIFQTPGILPDGKYLPGEYAWTQPVSLRIATLRCTPPSSGSLVLRLELGGILTTLAFTVTAGSGSVQERMLGLIVPANTVIRWKAAFTGVPAAAASAVAVTVEVAQQGSSSGSIVQTPTWPVFWVDGPERVLALTYVPATHTFTPTAYGAAHVGLGTSGSRWTLSLQGTAALVADSGTLKANSFNSLGLATQESPRLEFMVGPLRVGVLTQTEFRVAKLIEEAPPALDSSTSDFYYRYEFHAPSGLVAVLTASGLTAGAFSEPL